LSDRIAEDIEGAEVFNGEIAGIAERRPVF
jgi:hypothetical protein